jgi:hypothetical protein
MPNSPLPNPLSELGARRFSFYPPIRNIEHNEWQFRRATWSEIVVVNTRSGEEALIPRASVGEVSIIDDPVVIVGLRRELEWLEGAIYPHRRRVIEFPLQMAVNDSRRVSAPVPGRLAPVVNIRLEPAPASRKSIKIAVAVMLGAVLCLVAADIAREAQSRQRGDAYRHPAIGLTYADGYSSIVSRLGLPAGERVKGDYQLLVYPERRVSLILKDGRYIGAIDSRSRILDTVLLPNQTSSASLLRSLPPF